MMMAADPDKMLPNNFLSILIIITKHIELKFLAASQSI